MQRCIWRTIQPQRPGFVARAVIMWLCLFSNAQRNEPMRELLTAIPDGEALLALEPEELGAKLLFLARARSEDEFNPEQMASELWPVVRVTPEYPRQRQSEILLAMREASAWLEAQGLIVPAHAPNGRNGWRVLSRRAGRFEIPAGSPNYAVARRLPNEKRHSRIS